VSVDGFKEKVKALEDAGLSANDAFKEAFLQQAEEQVRKVGNAADSSIGGFMRLEAAVKNLGDQLKMGIAKDVADLMDAYDRLNEAVAKYNEESENSIASAPPLVKSISDTNKQIEYLKDNYTNVNQSVDMTAESTIALEIELAKERILLGQIPEAAGGAGEAVENFAVSSESAALAVDNFLEKAQIFKDDFGEAFDVASLLEGQTGGVKMLINELGILGSKYTELKANLDEGLADATMRLNVAIQTVYQSVAGQLSTALDNANLSLEQLRAGKSAIDTVFGTNTRLELELGLKVDEWAKLLIEDPEGFVAQMSEIQATTLKFDADTQKAMQDIADLQAAKDALEADTKMKIKALINDTEIVNWQPPDKYGTVYYSVGGVRGFIRAAGGEVKNAASGVAATLPHYWVGELGPEPFFPETNGRIVSNTQAMSALRSGAEGGGSSQPIVVNITTPVNLADRVWVERELAPYIRDALRKAGK